jgi:hypothetical protein
MEIRQRRCSSLQPLIFLLCCSVFIADAADFGTSDIYTASIVAARNSIPVLLYRDAQCKLCPKVEDFLVGLGALYQTVRNPFVRPSNSRNTIRLSLMPRISRNLEALIAV